MNHIIDRREFLVWTGAMTLLAGSGSVGFGAELSGANLLEQNAASGRYTYLVFYRNDDSLTRRMESAVESHVKDHADRAAWQKVHVYSKSESAVVEKFDARRLPLPSVIGVAPNGAVTCIYHRSVSSTQLSRSILSPRYADVVLALQNGKIAVVSLLPSDGARPSSAAERFLDSEDFSDRSEDIRVSAKDPAEQDFFSRVKVSTDLEQPKTILFAPPGRHLGTFDDDATFDVLAEKVHASGSCNCEKCKKSHGR
ncbi:hypothetical protein [Rubinisphaera margarita]|uniref:hypothetical protein n=1 Tax=Rubinisphaera margarita TaxID=2909586 RepID=UPI001EE7E572|nr:hypothetical protein [Rubinisphaera margarita]MCG6158230.1 hypothetical protein [Rubinisphaera margarita]